MFAGPGGTLMGTSNANNLDRIRIFNNYQPPSIDQIEDDEDLEGKLDSDEEYDDAGNEYVESGYQTSGARRSGLEGKSGKKYFVKPESVDTIERGSEQNRRETNGNKYKIDRTSTKRDKTVSTGKETDKRENYKSKSTRSKLDNFRTDKVTRGETAQRSDRSELYPPLERDSSQSLYKLEPRTKSYESKAYKQNLYGDTDEDSMIFQTRDDTSNRARTGKVNQPFIEMMTNILDTIQLTSKHDYKRAKERELRDKARDALQRLHPDS